MLFSDMQTKHFYALGNGNTVAVKNLTDSSLCRIMGYKNSTDQTNNKALFTTDILNKKLIKHIKINQIKPIYLRKWTVVAPSAVTAGNTYHIYFYLENMMGFGIQDRWDKVASYTAKTGDNASTVMTALKNDLDLKLNSAGPIKNDFTVTLSGTSIVVAENPDSETFAELTELDIRMHSNPYAYNVTMSTGEASGNEITPWGGQKQITATDDTNNVYISAYTQALAMELYFLRNRADKYDLTKPFGISILNESNLESGKSYYYTLDIDYAFSDTQGYTYHSDKQLSICAGNNELSIPTILTNIKDALTKPNVESLDARVTALEG